MNESVSAADLAATVRHGGGVMDDNHYAPPNEDGLKPWVRESYHFGRTTHEVVYAATAAEVRHMYARMHLEKVSVRRARMSDLPATEEE